MIENAELRKLILDMWEVRFDTARISRVLHMPEATIERELHAVLEIRRAVDRLTATEGC